jgi:hypothetical protein
MSGGRYHADDQRVVHHIGGRLVGRLHGGGQGDGAGVQGLKLVPNLAELELFRPPCYPT